MIVPKNFKEKSGVAAQARSMECRECGQQVQFDIIYYVVDEDWPELRLAVRNGSIAEIECHSCGSKMEVRFPIILELLRRNLLIFVTHTGDDEGVEAGFKKWFSFAAMLIDQSVIGRAKQRPYTFVHGWNGLVSLLKAFEGETYFKPDPPFPHGIDQAVSADVLDGYIYGDLLFFYPDQLGIKSIVHALLRSAECANDQHRAMRLRGLMLECVTILNDSHPWLSQEIGRLSLELGDIEQADTWLSRAQSLKHKWVGVTASFMDATPRRRVDGETQDESLPHTLPASILGDVLSNRHTVTRVWPSENDYGLWYFPAMEQAAVPEEYTLGNILKVTGIVLGELERDFGDNQSGIGMFDFNFFVFFLKHACDLIHQLEYDGESDEELEGFWGEYVTRRWPSYEKHEPEKLVGAKELISNHLLQFKAEAALYPPSGIIALMKIHEAQQDMWRGALAYLERCLEKQA